MARFDDITDDDLSLLLENRDSLSTKNVIKCSTKVLHKYCEEKRTPIPSEGMSNSELSALLSRFYASARTADGNLYTKKSMLSIRYGLQKHFVKMIDIDIVNCPDFQAANNIFQAVIVKLKHAGKAKVQHKDPVTKKDLQKLYEPFDLQTPRGLQNKVFVDFMIYFCNRGRENLRDIKKTDFIFDENDRYIEMRDMATKNHQGGTHDDAPSQGGRIYKTGKELCPYASFMTYAEVLNPNCAAFFQRPKSTNYGPARTSIWFDNAPLGKNQLGDKMKKLSEEANLSKTYTNHCLRATSITLLNGYEARHVMAISGHKSETSIRSYARTSDDQKEKMAMTLAAGVSGEPTPAVENVEETAAVQHPSSDNQEFDDLKSGDLLELSASQELLVRQEILEMSGVHQFGTHSSASGAGPVEPQRAVVPATFSGVHQFGTHSSASGAGPVEPLRAVVPATFGTFGSYNRSETMEVQHSVRHSSYAAPVYNIQNSVVHIHHHH